MIKFLTALFNFLYPIVKSAVLQAAAEELNKQLAPPGTRRQSPIYTSNSRDRKSPDSEKEEEVVDDLEVTFGASNPNWNHAPEYNRAFLRAQQTYLNEMLRRRGHLFLNEVYDVLGFERTRSAAVTGWLLYRKGEETGFVDFGLDDEDRFASDGEILITFNTHGSIWDKI